MALRGKFLVWKQASRNWQQTQPCLDHEFEISPWDFQIWSCRPVLHTFCGHEVTVALDFAWKRSARKTNHKYMTKTKPPSQDQSTHSGRKAGRSKWDSQPLRVKWRQWDKTRSWKELWDTDQNKLSIPPACYSWSFDDPKSPKMKQREGPIMQAVQSKSVDTESYLARPVLVEAL